MVCSRNPISSSTSLAMRVHSSATGTPQYTPACRMTSRISSRVAPLFTAPRMCVRSSSCLPTAARQVMERKLRTLRSRPRRGHRSAASGPSASTPAARAVGHIATGPAPAAGRDPRRLAQERDPRGRHPGPVAAGPCHGREPGSPSSLSHSLKAPSEPFHLVRQPGPPEAKCSFAYWIRR